MVGCPSDPLQLPDFQANHYIWEVCWQIDELHWKVQFLQPALVNRRGPILLHNNKSWTNWAMKFCLTHGDHLTSHQPPLFQVSWQLFAGRMFPQPVGDRKCFSRVHQIPLHRFLHYRNKQTFLIAYGKWCWILDLQRRLSFRTRDQAWSLIGVGGKR